MKTISLTINGEKVVDQVEPRTSLADFLRSSRRLTGTHIGCEHGVCGACTVTIDGSPARSCIAYAAQMDGRHVQTIEGYDEDEVMAELRKEFSKQHGLQCGFCTPGMLITARDIVTRLGNPGEQRIREELAGNLCRCTGYAGIVQAVQNVGAIQGPSGELRQPPIRKPAPAFRLSERELAFTPVRAGSATAPLLTGGVVIDDVATIAAPLDRVWAFFHDLPAVAGCLPGAELSGHDAENWQGSIRVKIGPIRAQIAGGGSYRLDEIAKTGRLEGSGSDRISNSRVNGSLAFAAVDAGAGSTKLTLCLTYALQGPLAQFSRSSLAKEFVKLVVEEFGRNVSDALSGNSRRGGGLGIGRLLRVLLAALRR